MGRSIAWDDLDNGFRVHPYRQPKAFPQLLKTLKTSVSPKAAMELSFPSTSTSCRDLSSSSSCRCMQCIDLRTVSCSPRFVLSSYCSEFGVVQWLRRLKHELGRASSGAKLSRRGSTFLGSIKHGTLIRISGIASEGAWAFCIRRPA